MTCEGFMPPVMDFTGKEALRWKLAYITAFNRMESELQKPAHDPKRTVAWPLPAEPGLRP